MLNERDASVLLILHGLLSAGADPSEKTIDAAINGAALLDKKLAALPDEEEAPVKPPEEPATPPKEDPAPAV